MTPASAFATPAAMPRHAETRHLPFTAAQMFALVADVERYPEFLPWNSAARIRSRAPAPGGEGEGEVLEADLVISFKVLKVATSLQVLISVVPSGGLALP